MEFILRFENDDQVVLWVHELMGQISDGKWENASPHGHHRALAQKG